MVRHGARSGIALAVLLVLAAAAPAARAEAPRTALIVEGRGMAGVALRSHAPRSDDNTRITAGRIRDWGAVDGFCFEATNCAWDVRGGGSVLVILHPTSSRVQRMAAGERRFTFFELNAARTRVSEIWIGRGRVRTC